MPRGEQKNLKYNSAKEWIKTNVNGEEENLSIKGHYLDKRTLKLEKVNPHYRHWDSYERGIGAKKKVYAIDSGLKSAYIVTYLLGNHDLWTKHYLEAAKLSKEMDYLASDIEDTKEEINSWVNNQKIAKIIEKLETENKDKISSLCKERDQKELIYEKIISYEIPVRQLAFRDPYILKTDKYGIGPFNNGCQDEKFHRLEPEGKSYSRDARENSGGVLYSVNPQKSIENIRNDQERIERIQNFCYEIGQHARRVNQLKDVISGGDGYYDRGYSTDYDKIGDLSYFDNNIKVSIEIYDEDYEFNCAKSVILHAKEEHNKHEIELNRLTQLKEKKEKMLSSISSQSYLDKLYNEVDRVSKRRESIERLQRKRTMLNKQRERKEVERKRQEEIEKQRRELARLREEARVKREKELQEDMENYLLMLKGSRHGHGHKDSEGNEKTWYETKEEAIADALKLAKKKDRLLNPYYVMLSTPMDQQVKGWFLTSVADMEVA
jgi:hypothetical protein